MDVFYTHLTEQLARSRAYMAKARNKLAAITYRLPDEIIAAIFSFSMGGDPSQEELPLKDGIRSIYRRLYTLFAVCSNWLRIGLSTGALWSLIPVLEYESKGSRYSGIYLGLERFTSTNLYLAGDLSGQLDNDFLTSITHFGSRFRSLNLCGETYDTLKDTVACILRQATPGHLTDFSVCYRRCYPTPQPKYLFPPDSFEHIILMGVAVLLNTLRLSGFGLDWSTLRFTGLVQLRFQATQFKDASVMNAFLFAIASAPALHTLEMIDVYSAPIWLPNEQPTPRVSLPSLRTLYLQDLDEEILLPVVHSIAPGPYQTILSFISGDGFVIRNHPEGESYYGWLSALRDSKIDTLMIFGGWTLGYELNSILGALPSIQSLYIGDYYLDEEMLRALVRPIEFDTYSGNFNFPKIRVLYFWDCTFFLSDGSTLYSFKEVVTSHGIQELGLGGKMAFSECISPQPVRFDDPDGDYYTAPIKKWLTDNVPKFKLINSPNELPGYGFQADVWKLW
ncbi:hypothetical protein B0J17DRAFT_681479 [Rhizoctonia solani]|nr:hypothetical protein B0J17DRAFT_681479 [Rhizoctonia solani]